MPKVAQLKTEIEALDAGHLHPGEPNDSRAAARLAYPRKQLGMH
jgi:hypothetical protein